jgi:hypothetical protein
MAELTRFARLLVERLTAMKEGVHHPVSLVQIRETVLPYRAHRRALELDSVEDYETVLLRLAAEERGFAKTLPPAAAERCRKELATSNPDLALLDELAEATVQIGAASVARIMAEDTIEATSSRAPVREYALVEESAGDRPSASPVASAPARAPVAPSEAPKRPAAPREEIERKPTRKPPAPPAERPAETAARATKGPAAPSPRIPEAPMPAPPPAAASDTCRHCRNPVPTGRQVVFCPWCGQRLIPFTCERCQTELDSEWRHCITCGAPVKDPYRYV